MNADRPQNSRIGVDTGGTFTDLVLLDEHGMRVHKLRSTPHDPSVAFLAGSGERSALAREWSRAGHDVTLFSQEPAPR